MELRTDRLMEIDDAAYEGIEDLSSRPGNGTIDFESSRLQIASHGQVNA